MKLKPKHKMNYKIGKDSAGYVLKYLAELNLYYLSELEEETDPKYAEYRRGVRFTLIETLEVIQSWRRAGRIGLDFNIEEVYPIK